MRKLCKLSAAGLLSAMFLMNGATVWAGEKADTVYHGGKIYTMQEYTINEETKRPDNLADDVQPVMAEVVATKDGKIIFVGTKADAEAAGLFDAKAVDKIVDLKGKTMYPGFIDGHGHFPQQGQNDLYNVNLNSPLVEGTIDTMDKLIKACADRAAQLEKGYLVDGRNYDDTKLAEMRHPTAEDLDKASTEHPIIVTHISGHVKSVNTYCLKNAGLVSDDSRTPTDKAKEINGVEIKDGKVTGVLFETIAMGAVPANYPAVTQNNLDILTRCAQVYAAAGVTCVNNGAAVGLNALPGYWEAIQAGGMNVRVLVHPLGYYAVNIGGGKVMDYMGWQGRAQLGWKQDQAEWGKMLFFADGSNGVPMGTDITSFDVANYTNMQGDAPDSVTPAPEGLPENRVFLGAWKIIFDGSPQAYTAWMKSPGNYYLGEHTEAEEDAAFAGYKGFNGLAGTLNMSVDNLNDGIALYHKFGDSTETHTNGSGAAEAWLAAVERAAQLYPDTADTRTTSIHGQTLERQQVERIAGKYDALASTADMYTDLMGAGGKTLSEVGNLPELMKKNNLFINFFNNHVYFYGDRHHDIFFGPGRALNISPVGWAEAYDVPYTFHNDTFVTPISPLRSITSAVTRHTDSGRLLCADGVKDLDAKVTMDSRRYSEDLADTGEPMQYFSYDHRINALKALHAVTIGAAYQNKLDDRIGSIAEGKLADFTIMDKDVIQQAADDGDAIVKMRVATTIVDDQVVYGALPDAETFAFAPTKAFVQPAGNDAVVTAAEVLGKDEVQVKAGAVLGAVAMNATVKAGEAAVFSFNFLGNGKEVSDLQLIKIKNGEEIPFTLGRPADLNAGAEAIDGYWWISDFTDPLNEVKEGVLEENHMYVASFIIMDNGKFDASDEDKQIIDPVAVVSVSGTMPDNGQSVTDEANKQPEDPEAKPEAKPEASKSGGSDGGCTVGTNPAYELFALLLASLGVMAGRIFRRRENA